MKKNRMKFAALLLATAILLAMGTSVLASVSIGTSGYVSSTESVLLIPKGIIMRNTLDGMNQFYGPEITYSYTIAPVAPPTGATVSSGGNTADVHTGTADSISVTTRPVFSGKVNMSQTGIETTKDIELTVDLTKFTKPGVYRYVLTETTGTSDLYDVGIVRTGYETTSEGTTTTNAYQTTRYLDVYIERNDNPASGAPAYKVSGYVLMKNNPATNASGTIQKSVGFINSDGLGVDNYRTYNIRLEKKVEGTMGDKTHEFPFEITVTNNNYNYFWAKNVTALESFTDSSSSALTSAKLKDADIIYIRGLNPRAAVAYTETQDTDDIYKVKVTGQTDPESSTTSSVLVEEAEKAKDTTTILDSQKITTYETVHSASSVTSTTDVALTAARDVVFHNKMDSVSPTGVALRFGPYILMAAAAVVLLMVMSRRRKDTQDKDSSI